MVRVGPRLTTHFFSLLCCFRFVFFAPNYDIKKGFPNTHRILFCVSFVFFFFFLFVVYWFDAILMFYNFYLWSSYAKLLIDEILWMQLNIKCNNNKIVSNFKHSIDVQCSSRYLYIKFSMIYAKENAWKFNKKWIGQIYRLHVCMYCI